MKLRNVSPLGHLDLPLIGRVLDPGEVFDVDDALAGRAPSTTVDDDGNEVTDLGEGLLAQVGNFEAVDARALTAWPKPDLVALAARRGVDLTAATSKAQIVAALHAAGIEEDQ